MLMQLSPILFKFCSVRFGVNRGESALVMISGIVSASELVLGFQILKIQDTRRFILDTFWIV